MSMNQLALCKGELGGRYMGIHYATQNILPCFLHYMTKLYIQYQLKPYAHQPLVLQGGPHAVHIMVCLWSTSGRTNEAQEEI